MSEQKISDSFNQNYRTLKTIAERLRNQREPDIDALVEDVKTGMQAYQACKERLDAVEAALKEFLPPENATEESPAS